MKYSGNQIDRREFIKKNAGIAVASFLLPRTLFSRSPGSRSSATGNPPNIVFIISDQHRWNVAGNYGDPNVSTPNINQLASAGVEFEQMYCQFPVCVPSRQSIITSQYVNTHGTRKNNVPENMDTLINYLKGDPQYHNWLSGKRHMTGKGFEEIIDYDNLDNFLSSKIITERDNARKWYRQQYAGLPGVKKQINSHYLPYGVPALPREQHDENLFVDMVDNILDKHPNEQPFFLWISFKKPHTWLIPPEPYYTNYQNAQLPPPIPLDYNNLPQFLQQKYDEKFSTLTNDDIANGKRAYYACVEYVDYAIGLVREVLRGIRLDQNTITVYTADHGEMLGDHGLFFKNNFYDPAVHVPCIIHYPGVIPAGQVVNQITEQIDLMPTLFELAGIPLPQDQEVQGSSMKNLILNPGDLDWKNEAFSELGHKEDNHAYMIRRGPWKYNYHPNDIDQLFNMEDNPEETENLVDVYPEVREALFQRIVEKFNLNTDIDGRQGAKPSGFELAQNYPNPFNPSTTIRFSIPKAQQVQLRVFDALAGEVAILVDEQLPAGSHSIVFAARNLASGIYYYQLSTPAFAQTKSMILVR